MINIYQINKERDKKYLLFESLETHLKYNNGIFDGSIYDCVHGTNNKCFYSDNMLEELFSRTAFRSITGFVDRSISVSDVIQVDDKFFYCNPVGFVEIAPIKNAQDSLISAIIIENEYPAYEVRIHNSLETYQAIVGGYIESVCIINDCSIIAYCNEEGRIKHLKDNNKVYGIAGNVVVMGLNELGQETSLTDEQISKVLAKYKEDK